MTEEMCRWIEAFLSVLEGPGAWLVMAVCLEGRTVTSPSTQSYPLHTDFWISVQWNSIALLNANSYGLIKTLIHR